MLYAALESTQGQMHGFFSQLPFKCHLPEVASLEGRLEICPWAASRVDGERIERESDHRCLVRDAQRVLEARVRRWQNPPWRPH